MATTGTKRGPAFQSPARFGAEPRSTRIAAVRTIGLTHAVAERVRALQAEA